MANVFDGLTSYGQGAWTVTGSRNFNDAEVAAVQSAMVVTSNFGKSVQFTMKTGGTKFIPLSTQSGKNVGDSIDLKVAKLITLHKVGSNDIIRVEA